MYTAVCLSSHTIIYNRPVNLIFFFFATYRHQSDTFTEQIKAFIHLYRHFIDGKYNMASRIQFIILAHRKQDCNTHYYILDAQWIKRISKYWRYDHGVVGGIPRRYIHEYNIKILYEIRARPYQTVHHYCGAQNIYAIHTSTRIKLPCNNDVYNV